MELHEYDDMIEMLKNNKDVIISRDLITYMREEYQDNIEIHQ